MRVLVTGGAGFIGSHLTRMLIQSGYEVEVWDNLSNGTDVHLPISPRLDFRFFDVTRPKEWEVDKDPDFVVHCACPGGDDPQWAEDNPVEFVRDTVGSTIVLSRRFPNSHLIFLSSSDDIVPINTTGTPVSGRAKSVAEDALRSFHAKYTTIRVSNVFGIWDLPCFRNPIEDWISQIRDGKRIALHHDGEVYRDYIYVGDLCDLILRVIQSEASVEGIRRLSAVSGRSNCLNDAIAVAKELGFSVNTTKVPKDQSPEMVLPLSIRYREETDLNLTLSFEDYVRTRLKSDFFTNTRKVK